MRDAENEKVLCPGCGTEMTLYIPDELTYSYYRYMCTKCAWWSPVANTAKDAKRRALIRAK